MWHYHQLLSAKQKAICRGLKLWDQTQKVSCVIAIAKWRSAGVRIRKREPRGRNLKGRGGTEPSLPLGVSRVTNTKFINSDSVPSSEQTALALVETSSAYSVFLLCKKSVIRFTVSPLRKKSRSAQLFAYKCAHDAELSLPTFCGFVVLLQK